VVIFDQRPKNYRQDESDKIRDRKKLVPAASASQERECRRTDEIAQPSEQARERSKTQINDFGPPRLLIDGPQSAVGTINIPGNQAALISTRTNVSKASPSMSSFRMKGYRLSCLYGFLIWSLSSPTKRQFRASTEATRLTHLRASLEEELLSRIEGYEPR